MKYKLLAAIALVCVFGGVAWVFQADLNAASQIGPNTAAPAYVVVKTPTVVTFTSVIADSIPRKHDPTKVLLIRTDAAGTPIDIVGRMRDSGKKSDVNRNDHTYTVQITLNESSIGVASFRVAAKFKEPLLESDSDQDGDWDKDLANLNLTKDRNQLTKLLRRLSRFTLSNSIQVTVDPFELPPDPGEAGKQTLAGIDSDNDGIRDDIQRHVAYSYPHSQRLRQALFQDSTALQAIVTNANSPAAAQAAWTQALAALQCLTSTQGAEAANDIDSLLEAEFLNTDLRIRAYYQAGRYPPALDIDAELQNPASDLARYCIVNPSQLPN